MSLRGTSPCWTITSSQCWTPLWQLQASLSPSTSLSPPPVPQYSFHLTLAHYLLQPHYPSHLIISDNFKPHYLLLPHYLLHLGLTIPFTSLSPSSLSPSHYLLQPHYLLIKPHYLPSSLTISLSGLIISSQPHYRHPSEIMQWQNWLLCYQSSLRYWVPIGIHYCFPASLIISSQPHYRHPSEIMQRQNWLLCYQSSLR